MKSPGKIRLALATTKNWPRMKRAVSELADEELAEADRIERLGKRRRNMLMCLKAERHRRQGRGEKSMLRLKVEGNR